jgi:PTS system fructose-specific IIC component
VIDAGGRDVQALLAAEALRKAARTEGRLLEVAVRGERQTVDLSALDDNGQDLALLFVGAPMMLWASVRIYRLTLDAVLSDPAAAIRGSGGQTPTQKPRIVAITSCPRALRIHSWPPKA